MDLETSGAVSRQPGKVLARASVTAGRSVVTIGNFDGVHRGHQQLIDGVIARARLLGVASVVTTFDPHPLAVVRPEAAPALLTGLERRVELLQETGVDRVLVLPFTPEVSRWEPSEFVHRVLGTALGAVEVHVGENFRFGHRATGDVAMMGRAGAAYGFTVRAVPLLGAPGRWSSTAVRTLLAHGEVEAAAAVLGRPHRLSGVVAPNGRDGTLVLRVGAGTAVPADGAYAGRLVCVDGRRQAAGICVSTRPSKGDESRRCVELRSADGDAAGGARDVVAVDVLHRLRPLTTIAGW